MAKYDDRPISNSPYNSQMILDRDLTGLKFCITPYSKRVTNTFAVGDSYSSAIYDPLRTCLERLGHLGHRTSNMSDRRLPWSPEENNLLCQIYSEKPTASLMAATKAFNARNIGRIRSENAVKCKWRDLRGLRRIAGK